ncbi:MAG: choice-of-anchor J domain-containing protein [Bacteroidales bacterium]|nr:choice-of-anchor J domain-containing protein [Bacteroidales bacterium]
MKKFLLLFCALFAMTFLAKAQLPIFTEHFDSGIPAGWTQIDADGDGYVWETSDNPVSYHNAGVDLSGQGLNGSQGFVLSGSYSNAYSTALTPDNYLITPQINLDGSNATLTFWVCAQDPSWYAEHYAVMVSTTGTSAANFTTVFEETFNPDRAATPWQMKTVDLSDYDGQQVYIAFRHYNVSDMFILNLDEVNVTVTTTDPIITAASALNFGTVAIPASGTLTVPVQVWNLTSSLTATTTAPYAVSFDGETFGLTATMTNPMDTTYVLYVQYTPEDTATAEGTVTLSSTGATDVEIALTGAAVDCSNQPWPYSFNFDNAGLANCWTIVDVAGDGYETSYGTYGQIVIDLTNGYAQYTYHDDNAANDWLISPYFDIPENGAVASFDYASSGSYYPEKYSVYIIPEGGTYATATQIVPTTTVSSSTWATKYLDLTDYAGTSVQIAIKVESDADMNFLRFTNFFIGDGFPATMAVTPRSVNFGNVIVGQTKDNNVIINTTSLDEDMVISTEAPFAVSYNGSDFSTSVTIPANSAFEVTDTIQVQFAPVDTGTFRGMVVISTTELNDTVNLTGFAYSCDAITSVPQRWGFETPNMGGTSSYPLPACWSRLGSTTYPYSYSSYAHNGSYSLYTYNASNCIAVMPEINTEVLNIAELQLHFFARSSSTTSGLIEVGVMNNPTEASSFTMLDTVSVNNGLTTSHNEFELPLSDYTQGSYIALRFSTTGSIYVDDIVLENIPACGRPDTVKASNVTANTADITWVSEENAFNVYYKAANATDFTLANEEGPLTETSYTLTGLAHTTGYEVYVASICGDESEVVSNTVSFQTECGVEVAPYTENFTGFNTSVSPCWSRYSGLASSVFGGAELTTTTGGWIFDRNYVFPVGHPAVNNYGTNRAFWLVSPAIDLSGLEAPALSFDLALTDWNNANPIDEPGGQDDDQFMVIISTDNGATWSAANATIWNNSGTGNYIYDEISSTGDEVFISLSQYADSTIRIAFYVESTVYNGDNDLHIANLKVDEMPACSRPTGVMITGITSSEATVTWDNVEDGAWQVAYDTTGFALSEDVELYDAEGNSFMMQELEGNTTYDVYVRAACVEGYSEWTNVRTFTTLCNAFVVTDDNAYTEDFSANPDCWNITGWTRSSGALAHTYSYTNGEAISPMFDLSEVTTPYLKFSQKRTGYSGYYEDYDPEVLSVYYRAAADADWTLLDEYDGAVSSWKADSLPLLNASATYQIKFAIEGNYGSSYLDNIKVYNEENPQTCFAPAGLAVDQVTETSAMVSWTAMIENLTFELYYKAHSDTEYVTVTADEFTDGNSYQIAGLEAATMYDVYVATLCDDDTLETSVVSFTTQCEAFDSYPFVETFADTSATLSCWSVLDANNDGKTFMYNTTYACMYYPWHGTNAANDWLYSPVFVLDGSQIADFDYWSSSSWEEKFQVFAIASDGTQTALTEVISVMTDTHQNLVLDLSELEGAYQIGIHCVSAANKLNLYIDNFRVRSTDEPELTVDPASLNFAGEVGLATNAQTVNISGIALTEDISVTVTGPFEVSMDTIYAATATIPVSSGLMFDTTLRVRYNPTAGGTDNGTLTLTSGAATATVSLTGTAIDCTTPETVTYTESFENGFGCWQNNVVSGTSNWSITSSYNSSSNVPDGTKCAVATNSTTTEYVVQLISPLLDLSTVVNPYVKFNHIQTKYVNDQDELHVYYKASASAAPVLLTSYTGNISSWTVDSIALPNASAEYRIVFEAHLKYGHGVGLDMITVYDNESSPVVVEPTVVTNDVTNRAQTSVTLNGAITDEGNQTITARGFEWKAAADAEYTVVNLTTTAVTLTYDLSGLTAGTAYEYKAFAATANGTVYGDVVSFTTLEEGVEPCEAPTNVSATNVSQTEATISWTAGGDETEWYVEYQAGAGEWQHITANNQPTVDITGLTASTTYNVRVKAVCSADNQSDFATGSFTTLDEVGTNDLTLSQSISLMPNPADNYIDLRVNGNMTVKEAVVYNAFGQQVKTLELTDNHVRIDLSGMAAGMYFVRVNGDNGTATKKFIKK